MDRDDGYLQLQRLEDPDINWALGLGGWKSEFDVNFGSEVNAVCLPGQADDDADKYLGQHVTVSSYGGDLDLKHFPVEIAPKSSCPDIKDDDETSCFRLNAAAGAIGIGSPVVKFTAGGSNTNNHYTLIGVYQGNNTFTRMEEFGVLKYANHLLTKYQSSTFNSSLESRSKKFFNEISHGNFAAVRRLLKPNLISLDNLRNQDGFTPLMYAAFFGHLDIVKLLISLGADVNAARNHRGLNALEEAALNNKAEVMEYLLENGANLYEESSEYGIPLLHRLAFFGLIEPLRIALKFGYNVNSRTRKGETALHFAAKRNEGEMGQVLIEVGADIEAEDYSLSERPVHAAAQAGSVNLMTILLKKGANLEAINVRNETPLAIAISQEHVEVVKILLDYNSPINTLDSLGLSPISRAALTGNEQIMGLLIQSNANINLGEPLHSASEGGHVEVVKLLLRNNADPNRLDKLQRTPYILAKENNETEVMKILISNGADTTIGLNTDQSIYSFSFDHEENSADENEKLKDICGVSNNNANKWPWMVSAGFFDAEGNWIHTCGGSLITQQLVLTSAHCIKPSVTKLRIGGFRDVTKKPTNDEVMRNITKHYIHENFVQPQAYHDIAIWEMDSPVNFTDKLRPVCLPQNTQFDIDKHRDKLVTLTGYGNIRILKEIPLKIFSQSFCNQTHSNYQSPRTHNNVQRSIPMLFQPDLLCAGYEAGEYGSCHGDSGGPIVQNVNEKYVQIGLVQGGVGVCGDPTFPAIYIRLEESYTLQFIQSVLATFKKDTYQEAIKKTLLSRIKGLIRTQNQPVLIQTLNSNTKHLNEIIHEDYIFLLNYALSRNMTKVAKTMLDTLPIKQSLLSSLSDKSVQHPITAAIENNRTMIMELLLQSGIFDVDGVTKNKGDSFLATAVKTGNIDIVKLLLKHGADVNIPNNNFRTAIFHAVESGDLEIMKILIASGAKIDVRGKRRNFNLVEYAIDNGDYVDVVAFLLDQGLILSNNITVLSFAAARNRIGIARYLIQKGVIVENLGDPTARQANDDVSALYSAQTAEMAKILVEEGNATLEIEDERGYTPLCFSSSQNNPRVMKYLLQVGANIEHRIHSGFTPFLVAVLRGSVEAAKFLFNNGCNTDVTLPKLSMYNAMHVASQTGTSRMLKFLLDEVGLDIESKTDQGETPIMMTMNYFPNVEALDYLLSRGANLHARDSAGQTSLHHAVLNKDTDSAKLLLDKGINVNSEDNDEYTPLYVAAEIGDLDMVRILVKDGKAIVDTVPAPLYTASSFNSFQIVDFLAKRGNVDIKNELGQTPLMEAAFEGHSQAVQVLLKNNADPNIQDQNGDTALHRAMINQRINVISILLDHGCNVNLTNKRGMTPLMMAVKQGQSRLISVRVRKGNQGSLQSTLYLLFRHMLDGDKYTNEKRQLQMVETLLKNNANPNIKSENGTTALHMATKQQSLDLIKILSQYGSDMNVIDKDGMTPLIMAIKQRNTTVSKTLLQNNANPDTRGGNGTTALHAATEIQSFALISLLADFGSDMNAINNDGITPLMMAVRQGTMTVAKTLLKSNADPDIKGENDYTALHMATEMKNLSLIAILLDYKADLNLINNNGMTPLAIASKNGDLTIVRYLVERGAKPNK